MAPRPTMSAQAAGLYQQALQAFANGDLPTAKTLFEQTTQADPRSHQAYYSLGVTQERLRDAGLPVTDVVFTPGAWAEFVQDADLQRLLQIRRWTDAGRKFFNAYGPTEATVFATYIGPMTTTEEVTIGRSPAGVGAMVLDAGLRPTPTGVIGELYLTGDQVVLGYLNRMRLTSERFVADPFGTGTRMYRTGDRVRRLADGRLVYHGRGDFQMKVRGMRVEPGEVDAVLNTYPGVANALSMGVPGPAGATVLVSYVTPVKGGTLFPDDVIDFAAQSLPSHMVPQSVVVVDEFELTPVGKIDRKKLPTADFTRVTDFVAPRTQLESVIADVFAQTDRKAVEQCMAQWREEYGTLVIAEVMARVEQSANSQELDLSGLGLTDFPHPLISRGPLLRHVRVLYLGQNRLTQVPEVLARLPCRIHTLDLSNNLLVALSDDDIAVLQQIESLVHLRLANCRIRSVGGP